MLGVRPPGGPGVEDDGPQVGGPGNGRHLGHAQLVGVATRRKRDTGGLEPLGVVLRDPLLVDRLALDAVGESLQRARPLEERMHDARTYRQVVVDQVELGLATTGEVDLLGVGDANRTSLDLELYCRGRSHEKTLPPVSRFRRVATPTSCV